MSDVHSSAGSYAVDALNPVERAEFETHLVNCPSCQAEVTEFADTLGELNLLVSTSPPPLLRTSVLAAVGGLAQVRPQRSAWSANGVGQGDGDGSDAAPRRAMRAPVTEIRPLEPHEVAPLEEHPSVVPDTPWLGVAAALSEDMDQGSRRRNRVLGVLLAIALVLALVLGGLLYFSQQQLQAQSTEEQQEVELLTAADLEVYQARREGMTAVSYVVSDQRNQLMMLGNNLPAPKDGSLYQVWILKKDAAAISAGTVPEGGDVRHIFLNTSVSETDGFALSLEPAPDGSKTPGDQLFKAGPKP